MAGMPCSSLSTRGQEKLEEDLGSGQSPIKERRTRCMLTVDLAHLAVVYLVSTSYDVLGGSGPQFYIVENQSSACGSP